MHCRALATSMSTVHALTEQLGLCWRWSTLSQQQTPHLPFIATMVLPAANTSSSELGSHSILRVYSPAQHHNHH